MFGIRNGPASAIELCPLVWITSVYERLELSAGNKGAPRLIEKVISETRVGTVVDRISSWANRPGAMASWRDWVTPEG